MKNRYPILFLKCVGIYRPGCCLRWLGTIGENKLHSDEKMRRSKRKRKSPVAYSNKEELRSWRTPSNRKSSRTQPKRRQKSGQLKCKKVRKTKGKKTAPSERLVQTLTTDFFARKGNAHYLLISISTIPFIRSDYDSTMLEQVKRKVKANWMCTVKQMKIKLTTRIDPN